MVGCHRLSGVLVILAIYRCHWLARSCREKPHIQIRRSDLLCVHSLPYSTRLLPARNPSAPASLGACLSRSRCHRHTLLYVAPKETVPCMHRRACIGVHAPLNRCCPRSHRTMVRIVNPISPASPWTPMRWTPTARRERMSQESDLRKPSLDCRSAVMPGLRNLFEHPRSLNNREPLPLQPGDRL